MIPTQEAYAEEALRAIEGKIRGILERNDPKETPRLERLKYGRMPLVAFFAAKIAAQTARHR